MKETRREGERKRRTPLSKSRQMARVKTKNTEPELLARRLLCDNGVRYRKHLGALPGTPDIYIARLRLAIFIHGCFWHGHHCKRGRLPRTRTDFWKTKITANRARDLIAKHKLDELGVAVQEWWTCEMQSFAEKAWVVGQLYAARSSQPAK